MPLRTRLPFGSIQVNDYVTQLLQDRATLEQRSSPALQAICGLKPDLQAQVVSDIDRALSSLRNLLRKDDSNFPLYLAVTFMKSQLSIDEEAGIVENIPGHQFTFSEHEEV